MTDDDTNDTSSQSGDAAPADPHQYTVQAGDYVSKVADAKGFSDYQTIWNDGHNAHLKAQRKTPNVLAPGDPLYIPDRETRNESRSTDSLHQFELTGTPLKLRLIVKDMTDKPVAGKPCTMKVDGSPDVPSLSTNGTGMAERDILPTAATGELVLRDTGLPIDLDLQLKIGFLEPLDDVTGQKARLNNLGYDAGEVNDTQDLQFRSAVEEFQCDHGLAHDGVCGSKTQAKLKEVHGC
jgi:N-acetylmuramoyl-L-alanine amidase